jgi:hypothetical protein
MNSTDERRIASAFHDHIEPAARQLRERGVRFFPLGPDDEASWYAQPPTGPDFFSLDPEACGRALRERWQAQDLPELVALVDPLIELAGGLEIAEEDTPDISPFVYVMY